MNIIKQYHFLPKAYIEAQANKILQEIKETKYFRPGPLDATLVAEFLDLDVEWFPFVKNEEETIAALILPVERKILINEKNSTLKEGFVTSTVAHEIGHWVLHINEQAINKKTQDKFFLCRQEKNLRGIEWQAQYFASCLLMPKFKLEKARQGRELTNWNHLYAITDELGVTISNLCNRLQDLGWIHIPTGSKQIYYP